MRELLERREALLRKALDDAEARLAEIEQTLARDGLTVPGSRGNLRPHPLLRVEAELKREAAVTLVELLDVARRLESERLLEEANALTAWNPAATPV